MKAIRLGRLIVYAFVALAGGVLWIYEAIGNAWNYTRVKAQVEQVEALCVGKGVKPEEAGVCTGLERPSKQNPLFRYTRVKVRYVSPVDQREHLGAVYLPGDRREKIGRELEVLAHDRSAVVVKGE